MTKNVQFNGFHLEKLQMNYQIKFYYISASALGNL